MVAAEDGRIEVGVAAHVSVIQWERGADPSPKFHEAYANTLEMLREQVNMRRS